MTHVKISWKRNTVALASLALICSCIFVITMSNQDLPSTDLVHIQDIKFRIGGRDKQPVVQFKRYTAGVINGTMLVPWLGKNKRLKEKNLQLPKCPSGIRLNGDDAAVEKLTHCVEDKTGLMFPVTLESWRYTKKFLCGDRFVMFHKEAALLMGVTVDVAMVTGECNEDEMYTVEDERRPTRGFFKLESSKTCTKVSNPYFIGGNSHLAQWADTVMLTEPSLHVDSSSYLTIAIRRYEHHNIYHTMSDIYNAFLVARYLGISPSSVDILFLDGKSSMSSKMLPFWRKLFHGTHQLCHLDKPIYYPALFWNKRGIDSDLLDFTAPELPLSEDFANFVLTSFKIQLKQLDCLRPLTALLVSRGNYMSRNISRQITNEKEILYAINNEKSVGVSAQWVRLEHLDTAAQLRLAATADILVGMHGAGLTLALFLPPHA
uniref:EGF domain-specific O-linked N-acetylglucosamine transferase n=2 Tax=Capitella teleta TaxID=283909 RepID=X2A369_CAPTE